MRTQTPRSSRTTRPAHQRIRILLADVEEVVREGLRAFLEKQPDMDVVADVGDGRTAVGLVNDLKPDVAIMDIGMPGLNGVDATRHIVDSRVGTKVLCLTAHHEQSLVKSMLKAGASGYVLRTGSGSELLAAVRAVAAGETHLSPAIVDDIVAQRLREHSPGVSGAYTRITQREREVLQLVAEGHDTKVIADRLGVSPKTVLAHRGSLMRKLDVESTVSLARYAIHEGLAQL